MKWRDPRTSNAMWVPSQHSLPLQELSLRQRGHREWCPPLQLQKPAMLFQQTGHIKRNDLGTCTPLSLIPGPSWLSISSFVFADLVAISFPGGKIAVTIGRCPLQSIAWLQGKLPLSIGILRILQEFKSQKWSNSSQCSLPQSPKICLDTSGYKYVHNCSQASGDFTGSSATSSWVALSGTCQGNDLEMWSRAGTGLQYTSCATSVPCENTAGQKWPKAETKKHNKIIKNLIL